MRTFYIRYTDEYGEDFDLIVNAPTADPALILTHMSAYYPDMGDVSFDLPAKEAFTDTTDDEDPNVSPSWIMDITGVAAMPEGAIAWTCFPIIAWLWPVEDADEDDDL